jgi:hypothetical protein
MSVCPFVAKKQEESGRGHVAEPGKNSAAADCIVGAQFGKVAEDAPSQKDMGSKVFATIVFLSTLFLTEAP